MATKKKGPKKSSRVSYRGKKSGGKKPKKINQPHGKSAKRRHKPAAARAKENAAALALARTMAEAVASKKASDIVLLDVRGMASYADYLLLASGESDRQVVAMADAVHEVLKPQGVRPVSTEGQESGSWVLLDYGDVVAHLFQADSRVFYDLEGLWADAPRITVDV